jgi:proteasome alpha subunit
MYPVSPQAYDRAITVFSPDGRLFQVEYAREAVKRGTTALGIAYKEGVLLAISKKIVSKLQKGESIEKIFKIDDHVGAATSGLVADARRLVDYARETAQEERFIYNSSIDVEHLTRRICDLKQAYTQFGGARPFGAALLVAGVDETGVRLFETDPSGAMGEWNAVAIGAKTQEAEKVFEKEYNENMSFDEAVKLALSVLSQVGDKAINKDNVDLTYIDNEKKEYTSLTKEELEKYINGVSDKK